MVERGFKSRFSTETSVSCKYADQREDGMKTMGMAWMAAAIVATPTVGQEVVRLTGDDVRIYDLVGEVEVVQGGGPDVVVRIERGGDDAASLRVETGEIDGRPTLRVIFPSDEVVYPEMGRGSNTTFSVREDGTFGDGNGRDGDRVRITGSGSGLEAWADLVIEVPVGRTVSAYLAAGRMTASGVDGNLRLDTGSGRITASNITGALDIDSGSGSVSVNGVEGSLRLDTGSGGVEVMDITGDEVLIDTGSGTVDVSNVQTEMLTVDTGSGGVELNRISSSDVTVDTGSGRVEVELLTDVDRLVLDTGSGSVTVRVPSDTGAMVEIDTGSGGIDLDFPLEVSSVRRDRVQGRIGDGDGSIRIDTGSGSVRVLTSN
jgi:lia operon protein LiaG